MKELLNAYHTNTNYRGAIVRGLEYLVNADYSYTCSIFFELIHSPELDMRFWETDGFELDKYIIAVNKKERLTEFVFRNEDGYKYIPTHYIATDCRICNNWDGKHCHSVARCRNADLFVQNLPLQTWDRYSTS